MRALAAASALALLCAAALAAAAEEAASEFVDDRFEGDIVTNVGQVTDFFGAETASDLHRRGVISAGGRRLGAMRTGGLWNLVRVNGRAQVPYAIHPALASDADLISSVLTAFGDRIRYVQFVPRTTEFAYLHIQKLSGIGNTAATNGRHPS